jgi:hypothetical protein
MELLLELPNKNGIHVEGNVSIVLPDYFTELSPELVALASQSKQASQIVVAVGRKDMNSDVEFVTASGTMMYAETRKLGLPPGRVTLDDCGFTIVIGKRFEVAADWLIDVSRSVVTA